MQVELTRYQNKSVCVALSGGVDSMVLLHYLWSNAKQWGITLSAVHCNHAMRNNADNDARFVQSYCQEHGIPLLVYKTTTPLHTEEQARAFRRACYVSACQPQLLQLGEWLGADMVATAHHQNDNAETLLFRLARGTSLSGMKGIVDTLLPLCSDLPTPEGFKNFLAPPKAVRLVHPLLGANRLQIDDYARQNAIPFVTDETNLTDDYTRNTIRHHVLPQLEKAVCGATQNIARFAKLATEEDDYLTRQAQPFIKARTPLGWLLLPCEERVLFRRAVLSILHELHKKDYTAEQLDSLFALQNASVGKKFCFLDIVAVKEAEGVAIMQRQLQPQAMPLALFLRTENNFYNGHLVAFTKQYQDDRLPVKKLIFNSQAIPQDAVIRTVQDGDIFTKFGGGTKTVSDYFTDKKIPRSLRPFIPVVASGNQVYLIVGIEIADQIKITDMTPPFNIQTVWGWDYQNINK